MPLKKSLLSPCKQKKKKKTRELFKFSFIVSFVNKLIDAMVARVDKMILFFEQSKKAYLHWWDLFHGYRNNFLSAVLYFWDVYKIQNV